MRHSLLLIPLYLILASCANEPIYKIPWLSQTSVSSGHMLHKSKYAELCEQGHKFTCEINSPSWRQEPSLSILQGLTWLHGAYVNVVGIDKDKRQYWLATQYKDKVTLNEIKFTTEKISASSWVIESFQVPLTGDFHDLIVVGPDGILDLRRIQGRSLASKRFRLALTSCMDHSFNRDQDALWKSLSQDDPDYIFLLGDNVYATKALGMTEKSLDRKRHWLEYVAMRRRLHLYRLPRLIPVLAIWDDHDYGMRDGDRTHRYKRSAKRTFQSFFAQPNHPPYFEHGPANSAIFRAFKTQFFLMDNRSHREPKKSDSGKAAHWGIKQEQWLFSHLKKNPIASWLLNGDQFFGGYHEFESFEGSHPKSFANFLSQWRESKVPLIFASGDRHLTEFMEINPPDSLHKTYEITASPAHAKTYPSRWIEQPNPRKIAGADLKINYVIVDGQSLKAGQELRVTAKGKDGKTLYSEQAEVDWPSETK